MENNLKKRQDNSGHHRFSRHCLHYVEPKSLYAIESMKRRLYAEHPSKASTISLWPLLRTSSTQTRCCRDQLALQRHILQAGFDCMSLVRECCYHSHIQNSQSIRKRPTPQRLQSDRHPLILPDLTSPSWMQILPAARVAQAHWRGLAA